MPQTPEQLTRQWLNDVVIGLNFCPFAGLPNRAGRVRIVCSEATNDSDLLRAIEAEYERLNNTVASELETTLLVVPNMLDGFQAYTDFLVLLAHSPWEGVFQVASFHPQYQFDGVAADAPENLTNRAPYPIFHFIREASLEAALAHYENPEQIPERNIDVANALTAAEKLRLFPYLFTKA